MQTQGWIAGKTVSYCFACKQGGSKDLKTNHKRAEGTSSEEATKTVKTMACVGDEIKFQKLSQYDHHIFKVLARKEREIHCFDGNTSLFAGMSLNAGCQ